MTSVSWHHSAQQPRLPDCPSRDREVKTETRIKLEDTDKWLKPGTESEHSGRRLFISLLQQNTWQTWGRKNLFGLKCWSDTIHHGRMSWQLVTWLYPQSGSREINAGTQWASSFLSLYSGWEPRPPMVSPTESLPAVNPVGKHLTNRPQVVPHQCSGWFVIQESWQSDWPRLTACSPSKDRSVAVGSGWCCRTVGWFQLVFRTGQLRRF